MTYYVFFIPFILINFKPNYLFYKGEIPKSHMYLSQPLQSSLEIQEIIGELNSLLPQLTNFINQFNSTVSDTGINVITDSVGNMSIDVPDNMPDDVANKLSTRIGVIDRLITTRGQEINDLLHKGLQIENKLKMEDNKYIPRITEKIKEFERLNASYKH